MSVELLNSEINSNTLFLHGSDEMVLESEPIMIESNSILENSLSPSILPSLY